MTNHFPRTPFSCQNPEWKFVSTCCCQVLSSVAFVCERHDTPPMFCSEHAVGRRPGLLWCSETRGRHDVRASTSTETNRDTRVSWKTFCACAAGTRVPEVLYLENSRCLKIKELWGHGLDTCVHSSPQLKNFCLSRPPMHMKRGLKLESDSQDWYREFGKRWSEKNSCVSVSSRVRSASETSAWYFWDEQTNLSVSTFWSHAYS